ncbi:MAG: hypothetical protein HN352_14450 [Bacteroidetes bacterium]|jgi:hypothetical protein|nr:hypothetical protein [Bacteroidota bacterium]MBT3748987.1 hypothetical protein [Bacteroidota bacterium]MBT4409596.1 hypothetical protein [Bacteroidota bacterium]MBT7094547.1 hypothetical protein [Bacteroidota bacterium]MBT7464598.1 hypothetical protein [Bacteroidota bacterium]
MRKELLVLSAILVSITLSQSAAAQWLDEVRLSAGFGFREIQCEGFAPGEHLDFIDYLEANKDYPEDEYLGFALLMNFKGPWQTDLRFTLNSGFYLSGYNLKIRYFLSKFVGISAGMLRHPYGIHYFEEYLINRDVDYYTDVRGGSKHKYITAADKGWMAGLVFPLEYKFLHLTLQVNGGVSSIVPFREEFGQKRINSNFRRDLVYETRDSYNWFFFPEAAFFIDLLRIRDVRIGVQAQARWYLTKKYLNYTLSTYEWTYNSPKTMKITSPSHLLKKLEYDIGLVVRW